MTVSISLPLYNPVHCADVYIWDACPAFNASTALMSCLLVVQVV